MSNPYLQRKREQYEAIRNSIEGVQTRAAEENRDLTEDELRSVKDQGEQAKTIAAEIESLTEIETRSRSVAALAAKVADSGDERRTTNASVNHRDPGHYRSVQDGGQHSFFADLVRSRKLNDEAATQRLAEHTRALEPTAEGGGILPPKWMADEFAELARQGRRVADVVRRIPISDNRPISLPKQTAGTDDNVQEMSTESGTTTWTDKYDTDVDTLTPRTTSGGQEFRRELFDGSSPAIDSLVYGDLLAAYNAKVEAKVVAAILGAGPTALEYDDAAADTTDAAHAYNVALSAGLAVRQNRKLGATGLVMGIDTYGLFLGAKDSTGRPVMPPPTPGSAVNVFGVGSVNVDGIAHTLPVFATDGVATTDAGEFAAVRLSDVLLAESSVLRFYDEMSKGPEVIRLAVWGYTGVLVRYSASAVQVVAPATS